MKSDYPLNNERIKNASFKIHVIIYVNDSKYKNRNSATEQHSIQQFKLTNDTTMT